MKDRDEGNGNEGYCMVDREDGKRIHQAHDYATQ
jgi:hypothetical protein